MNGNNRQIIEFINVTKRYGEIIGLDDVSIKISAGEFVFIIGESGAGKTTFIRLIQKEIDPDRGKIIFDGRDIAHLRKRDVPAVRQAMGMVFQDFRLLEKKTVFENVAFAMEILHKSKKEVRDRVPYVLELVGLQGKENKYPDELSAGEQQRVGIARALANNPGVLICDEPTGNLDHKTAREIMSILESINARGTTVIVATHALDIVKEMNRRVIAIDEGRVISDGIGVCDGDPLSHVNFIEELVALLGKGESALSTQERRTLYMSASGIWKANDTDDTDSFLNDYLNDEEEDEKSP